jgi:hypothetical protein
LSGTDTSSLETTPVTPNTVTLTGLDKTSLETTTVSTNTIFLTGIISSPLVSTSTSSILVTLTGIDTTSVALSTCSPPSNGDWIINSSCVLAVSDSAPVNVIVQNGAILEIPNGVTLDIDFTNFNITIKSGSGVLIKSGGAIT